MLRYDYVKPSSVEEVMGLLQEYGSGAVLVAGGTDVFVSIERKKIHPKVVISLKGVAGLNAIACDGEGGEVRIGALCTHRKIAESILIRERFSALHDAACRIGSLQIRNVATLGGNLANGLPSADTACPLLVLDAKMRIATPGGERSLSIDQFYLGPGKTALGHGEVLLECILPSPPPHSASCYMKIGRREAMELAMLGFAMMLTVDVVDEAPLKEALRAGAPLEDLYAALDLSRIYCREGRIALGVAAPTPIRAREAEAVLKGARVSTGILQEVGEKASQEARPRDTMRGSAWFRTEMVKLLPKRLAIACLERILFPGREGGL